MSKTNDGGRAFPERSTEGYDLGGMKLRDWLAGQALVGIVSAWERDIREEGIDDTEDRAEAERPAWYQAAGITAYEYADAMLAARDV